MANPQNPSTSTTGSSTTSSRQSTTGTQDTKEQAKQAASQAADEAKHQAEKMAGQAQEQASKAVEERKGQATQQLDSVAQAFRQTGQQLREQDNEAMARYTDNLAARVERFSGYLSNNDLNQFMADAEDMARRQPELFLGGAFTLGLLAARFLKSSSPAPSYGRSYRSYSQPSGQGRSMQGRYGWQEREAWRETRRSYGTEQGENYPVPAETASETTTGTATAGRTAGTTAGTTASTTTSGAQTTSRRTFDSDTSTSESREEK